MISATQNINSPDWTQLGLEAIAKRRLRVSFDKSEVIIHISNNFKPPISWFLTNQKGEMVMYGQISEDNYAINLKDLVQGSYDLRIAGEVHNIKNI